MMPIEIPIEQMIQGSLEWIAARLGIPTASKASNIVTPGSKLVQPQVRQKYLEDLAAETISGIPTPQYVGWEMREAAAMEDDSRNIYAMEHEVYVRQVALVYKDERRLYSCSPDGLIDPKGGFETKGTVYGRIQRERLKNPGTPREHIPQVQSSLYITERE